MTTRHQDDAPLGLNRQRIQQQLLDVTAGLNVCGLGVDVIAISRVESALVRRPDRLAQRLLSPCEWERYEQSVQPARYVAKQFAAKEAISKALGTGISAGVTFHQLMVLRDAAGAPHVTVTGAAQQRVKELGGSDVRVTISDDGDWAIAVAVVCGSVGDA